MLFDPISEKITAGHLQELVDHERASRQSYFIRRYNMHTGVITDPQEQGYSEAVCKSFFPVGKSETPAEYAERQKVWIPIGRIILNRIVALVIKGGVKVVISGDGNEAQAELANNSFSRDMEYNMFQALLPEMITEMLGIGEISIWPDYRRHNPQTGKLFDSGGRIKWTKRFPWIAEPVVHPSRVTEVIGSVAIYELYNAAVTPSVSAKMMLSGKSKLMTELWLSPYYSPETGEVVYPGGYSLFEDEQEVGPERFRGENPYRINPVTHCISPFKDETQYRGLSYYDLFVDMWLKLCRLASSEAATMQYMVPIYKMIADTKNSPSSLEFRQNAMVKIPQGTPQSDFGQVSREFTLIEEREYKKYLSNAIGEAAGYSGDFLTGMEGVGKVAESGVARKIVYEKTVDMVSFVRVFVAQIIREMAIKSLVIKNAENGGGMFDVDSLNARVIFDEDLIPISDLEALEYDLKLFTSGLRLESDLVMKYNDHIYTVAQADEFIANRRLNTQANTTAQQPQNILAGFLRADA